MIPQDKIYQTAQYLDLIDVALCYMLFDVCNEKLIEATTMSNFINWMNMKPTMPEIKMRPREKTRCCYMLKVVMEHILIKEFKNQWLDTMLASLGISRSFCDKHSYEVACDTHIDRNEDLVEDLKDAFKKAEQLKKMK